MLFLSHLTNISIAGTVALLHELGHKPPFRTTCDLLSSKLCAFPPSLQSHRGLGTWAAQRDMTQLVTDFERVAYGKTKRLFYISSCQSVTLYDELMGTRSMSNPVKSISY